MSTFTEAIALLSESLDANMTALKVCGVSANEFVCTTLQNHIKETNAHNNLKEYYEQYIDKNLLEISNKLDIIELNLNTTSKLLLDLESKISKMEKRNG